MACALPESQGVANKVHARTRPLAGSPSMHKTRPAPNMRNTLEACPTTCNQARPVSQANSQPQGSGLPFNHKRAVSNRWLMLARGPTIHWTSHIVHLQLRCMGCLAHLSATHKHSLLYTSCLHNPWVPPTQDTPAAWCAPPMQSNAPGPVAQATGRFGRMATHKRAALTH